MIDLVHCFVQDFIYKLDALPINEPMVSKHQNNKWQPSKCYFGWCYTQDEPAYNHLGYTQDCPVNGEECQNALHTTILHITFGLYAEQ